MNTKLLFTLAAIAAMLGTVGVVAIQPASAQVSGTFSNSQTNDQSACTGDCNNLQNNQQGSNSFTNTQN